MTIDRIYLDDIIQLYNLIYQECSKGLSPMTCQQPRKLFSEGANSKPERGR